MEKALVTVTSPELHYDTMWHILLPSSEVLLEQDLERAFSFFPFIRVAMLYEIFSVHQAMC